jgi:hypothetical protein
VRSNEIYKRAPTNPKEKKRKITYGLDPAINGVSEIFHFPPIAFFFFFFLLLLHLSAAFICYPFPTVGLDFLP